MPDPRRIMLGHQRPRQTRKEAEEMRRLSRLLGATAASARHNAILDCIEQAQEATSGADFGTRLGTLEAEARKVLIEANAAAGLTIKPKPIPERKAERPGLWLPPGTTRSTEG